VVTARDFEKDETFVWAIISTSATQALMLLGGNAAAFDKLKETTPETLKALLSLGKDDLLSDHILEFKDVTKAARALANYAQEAE